MAQNRVTIQFTGTVEEGGHIRLNAFIAQLEAVKAALKQTERTISGGDEPSVYYRVVDLSHSSPATVVLEAVSSVTEQGSATHHSKRRRRDITPPADHSVATVQGFFQSLKQIREKRERPIRADLHTLEAYRNLTAVLDTSVSDVRIINSTETIEIDSDFKSAIDEIIGPDELFEGSIFGMLERVNLHNTSRFDIFPAIGHKQVACDFRAQLKPKVIRSLDRYVCVNGKLRYKRLEDFPYAIDAEEIEIMPFDDELPNLFDIRGIAPNLTSGRTTEDFLEAIRDA